MTQIELAREGNISPQMLAVAEREGLPPETIRRGLVEGTIVVPANPGHAGLVPCGIGKGLSTKLNANVGTSADYGTLDTELAKVRVCLEYKADAVMDLSTGGDIAAIRRAIVADNQYFLRTFSPVKDREGKVTVAVTVASKNITERIKVEKALQESEELYRVLAEKSFAGVYVIQDGKICFINPNGASIAGYTPEELIGKESISFVHPEDRESLKKNAVEMLRGERTLPYEFGMITKEGKIIWFMETVTSIYW